MTATTKEGREWFESGKEVGLILAYGDAMQVLLTLKYQGHGGGNWRRLVEIAIEDLKGREEERLKNGK